MDKDLNNLKREILRDFENPALHYVYAKKLLNVGEKFRVFIVKLRTGQPDDDFWWDAEKICLTKKSIPNAEIDLMSMYCQRDFMDFKGPIEEEGEPLFLGGSEEIFDYLRRLKSLYHNFEESQDKKYVTEMKMVFKAMVVWWEGVASFEIREEDVYV